MKKLNLNAVLVVLSLGIMIVPFAGMTVAKTDTTTENRRLAELPSLTTEEGFNKEYFQQLGTYFEDHFAYKNELVAVDAQIQSKVFQESNVGTVLVGENDWLYYTDSLSDYLGSETVSERGAFNIAYNISLMQKKVESEKADFLFTVAPNKNSLYPDNMPYYDNVKASDVKNIDLVAPKLEELQVPYADLYAAFEKEQDTLYLKRDSHWNEKGAVLAYNVLMDALEKDHETYVMVPNLRTKTKIGDLGKALYSVNAEPEWDYEYQYDSKSSFSNEAKSWEDNWIQTENQKKKAKGNVLMFRDSFGNTLCKYIAEEFKTGSYAKDTVYFLDQYLEEVKPDTVIAEIVERNLSRFGKFSLEDQYSYGPPIMSATKADLDEKKLEKAENCPENQGSLDLVRSDMLPSYLVFAGVVDPELVNETSKMYIEVTSGGVPTVYDAFAVTYEETDYGFMMYLNSEEIQTASIDVRVITEKDGEYHVAFCGTFDIPSDEITE